MFRRNKRLMTLVIASALVSCNFTSVKAVDNSVASKFKRIYGQTRYETSIQISKSQWESSECVIIASGKDFSDALCSGPLAKKMKAPILLCDGENLTEGLKGEIKRLGAKKAYIIGGQGVILPKIEKELTDNSLECTRIGGKDRYETSLKIAEMVGMEKGAVIASAIDFPDSMSIAPIACNKLIPILLTSKNSINDRIEKTISENTKATYYIVGGQGVISKEVENKVPNAIRLGGKNRYETNVQVIKKFMEELSFDKVYLSVGNKFPDALCSSVVAANTKSPLILVEEYGAYETKDFVKEKAIKEENIVLIGSEKTMSNTILEKKQRPAPPKPPVIKPVPSTDTKKIEEQKYNRVQAMVKSGVAYGTLRKNVGPFKKGERVQIVKDIGNGKSYRVYNAGKSGTVNRADISIAGDPATDKTRLNKSELELFVNKKGFASGTKYFIWVDVNRQMVNVFSGSKGHWNLSRSFSCASGKNVTPTVRGNFVLQQRGDSFFNSLGIGALYWVRFDGNYLFHSILVNRKKQVVDSTLGKRASHGCIRVGLDNIKWIYNTLPDNTAVWIN
ncbi:cell wall-binding repeat-containing protein [Haloimpatiens sp. FM7315]|uniref:cell wall-binding repeat-containing protein n=1 Tax=Haloimpatiens sp. FM7315 TaxID=3298609 RepID=UPI00370C3F9A